MKKILHVTNRLSEGGVETFLLNLLPELNSLGYKVDLLVLDKNELLMKSQFIQCGINVIITPYKSIYDIRNIFFLSRVFKKYDLIHSHLFPSQYYVAISSLLTKKKIVTTEHCTINKRRKWLYWPLEFFIYSLYNSIVGVSEAASTNLKRWIPTVSKKIITIFNGIELKTFSSNSSLSKTDIGLNDSDFMIVMTARFFEQKDHSSVISALTYLTPDVKVVFIGSGERMQECQELALNLDVYDRVLFLGRRNDVAAIIKTSDICVLSTHYEGLPVSIIEYMSVGKAIIATNVDGVNEMIDAQFLFQENNPKDLSDKILLLKNNPHLRKLQAEKNKNNSEKFNLIMMINEYDSLYRKLS